ncbi:MAG: glycosyltransferase family 2 protein, partial [Alistipes sp.]
EIVRCFADPKVGCVAGEKRVAGDGGAAATEGVYWRYESKLKEWDDRLHTATGAAGELFAFRRALYEVQPVDTLLDDFMISMRIAAAGYRIAYCKRAYALETPSSDMCEEGKRKVRIAAGGLQSVGRLRSLLNPLRYGILSFQYISHRVLRWTLTPLVLVTLIPLNVILLWSDNSTIYEVFFIAQLLFYVAALAGWSLELRGRKNRLLFIPYYFLFMNLNVFRGVRYLATHRGCGAWEKARRA